MDPHDRGTQAAPGGRYGTPRNGPAARRILSVRTAAMLESMRSRLWIIPGVFAFGSAAAALVLVPLDHLVDQPLRRP